jgi:hypothetical protein
LAIDDTSSDADAVQKMDFDMGAKKITTIDSDGPKKTQALLILHGHAKHGPYS